MGTVVLMTYTPTSSLAVEADGLVKVFGKQRAVDGVSLAVPRGAVYGVLGPNGAGKTTTIKMLATLLRPDGGSARIFGRDVVAEPNAVRSLIGVTGQYASVDEMLSATENLIIFGRLLGLSRPDARRKAVELLEEFDLIEAANKPLKNFSGGMRRRLDLAASLISTPPLLFLDEPTTGLDPRSRRSIWEIIRGLVDDLGVTVFLTTQYLEEADHLADRIAVLDNGRIVAEGTAAELKRLIPGGHIRIDFADQPDVAAAQRAFGSTAKVVDGTDGLTLAVPSDGGVRSLRAVLDLLDAENIEAGGISVHTPNLDDVFLTLTGRATTEQESLR